MPFASVYESFLFSNTMFLFFLCSEVIYAAMDVAIGSEPNVNPPPPADTDTTDLEGEDE